MLPAKIPAAVAEEAMELAERAHEALGCRGVSRTDFRYDDTAAKHRLILLETNTQPGMTPTSLVPEQAAYVGMSYRETVPLDRGGCVMRSVKVERKPRRAAPQDRARNASRGTRASCRRRSRRSARANGPRTASLRARFAPHKRGSLSAARCLP